jgi:hypothetical protein
LHAAGVVVGFAGATTGEGVAADAVGPADERTAVEGESGAGEVAAATGGDAPAADPRPAVPPACGRSAPTTVSTTKATTSAARTSRLDGDNSFTTVQPMGQGQPSGDITERPVGPRYGNA